MKYILILTFIGLITVFFLYGFAFRLIRTRLLGKKENSWK